MPVCLILATPVLGRAQFQYFGQGTYGSVKNTPKWGIPYDDGNFQAAQARTIARGLRRLNALEAPPRAIRSYLRYPQTDIGASIDNAYDGALAIFTACGGALADKARGLDPTRYFLFVEPTIWQSAASPTGWSAGETSPTTKSIRVVNYYFSEALHELQWLPDLVLWEEMNHIAIETGVNGEYGSSPQWPCDGGPGSPKADPEPR
jgi:hypothetical protein